jgi:hypothetical protein
VIRDRVRAWWKFWTKDPQYFSVRRNSLRFAAPGYTAVAIYFFAIGYWDLGLMVGALAAFALWQWRKLSKMIEQASVDAASQGGPVER